MLLIKYQIQIPEFVRLPILMVGQLLNFCFIYSTFMF